MRPWTVHDSLVPHRPGRAFPVLLLLGASAPLDAQQGASPAAEVLVRGIVRDTAEVPIGAATVELLGSRRITITDRAGRFEIRIAPAAGSRPPRLAVRHHAHRPLVVSVPLAGDGDPPPLTITLRPLAVPLTSVVIQADLDRPMSAAATRQEIARAPPMIEPDALRALTLLPSVQQPVSMISRLHLAGAALDEALYTLDGHPLQSPNHVRGIGSGVHVGALDRVEVLSHHVPATVDARAGGVIAMHSRRPDGERDGDALLSTLSLSGAHAESSLLGAEVVLAGRVTYLDRVMRRFDREWFGDQFPVNDYHDGLVRVSRRLASGWHADLLGFLSSDLASRDAVEGQPWRGEYLGGLTLTRTTPQATHTVRVSRNLATRAWGTFSDSTDDALRSRQLLSSLSIEREAATGEHARLSTRLALTQRRYAHRWETRRELSPGAPARYEGTQSLLLVTFATQATRSFTPRTTGDAGVVADWSWRGVFLAPRLHLRWSPRPTLTLDASLERRHQFDGELGPGVVTDIVAPLFRFPKPRRLDGAALSATWRREWARYALSVRSDLYARRIADRPVSVEEWSFEDTTTRTAVTFERVRARSVGTGLALGLVGPRGMSLQLAYGLARTEERDSTGWVRSAWDRPHTLSLVAVTPRVWGFSLAATLRRQSGLPIAPLLGILPRPSPYAPDDVAFVKPLLGERNAATLPADTRLDLALRREWRIGRLRGELQAQLYNVAGTESPYQAYWFPYGGNLEVGTADMGRLPSLGVSFRW